MQWTAHLLFGASRHPSTKAAAALPPTAHLHHRLSRLRRRADSALAQAAQVSPAARTVERRRRLERLAAAIARTNVRLPRMR